MMDESDLIKTKSKLVESFDIFLIVYNSYYVSKSDKYKNSILFI